MFHCFLHEPVTLKTELRGLALNGRFKCQVTRLTPGKFITEFVEWEWQWVLIA